MANEILELLINTAVDLYTLVILVRLFLQIARADFYNPVSQFVVKATDPVIKPLRRFIPGFGGIDIASIVFAILVQALGVFLLLLLKGASGFNPLLLLVFGVFGAAKVALNLFFFAILILIIISWVAPGNYNPIASILQQITEPLMAPFRKLIPPMAGLDFSPMVVLLVIHILNGIVLPDLQASLLRII